MEREKFEKMVEMMKGCCPGEGGMADCFSMMKKMMDREGISALCAGIMEKVMKQQENGDSLACGEMMQRMMKDCNYFGKGPKETKE
jgi:hypothetical protein